MRRVPNRSRFLSNPSQPECSRFLLGQGEVLWRFQLGFDVFGMSSLQRDGRSRGNAGRSLHSSFFAKHSLLLSHLCLVCSVLGEFPTEPVTSEAHPYSPQARARRRFLYRHPVRSCDIVVLAQHLQQCSFSFFRLYLGAVVMADRRDWGGGGDDPQESTQ
ncbi:hypothetical protein Taro_050129 [Colocasia esculenta]|uniref:Uncharacterized protein n=1 Tax=Colocasia esculenta TaxID=4460 RepID=A0A843XD04_COLES|nr:hypothetical protein [Colocasia esculenta]